MCVTMALKSYTREFRNRMSNGTNIIYFHIDMIHIDMIHMMPCEDDIIKGINPPR